MSQSFLVPNLQIGVESVLPEYYLGKPVYAVLVDFGSLPDASSEKSIAHGISGMDQFGIDYGRSYVDQGNGNRHSLTMPNTMADAYWRAKVNATDVAISVGLSRTTFSAVVCVWYTKLADQAGQPQPIQPAQGALPIGTIMHLPFRSSALPTGWHFCNGDLLDITSSAGQALRDLPASFKTDWGVEIATCGNIRLPKLFHTDGRGYFTRATDGQTQAVGGVQGDAIRNIKGELKGVNGAYSQAYGWAFGVASGALKTTTVRAAYNKYGGTYTTDYATTAYLDASLVVPTAEENRPLNVGMTPAIYLGA